MKRVPDSGRWGLAAAVALTLAASLSMAGGEGEWQSLFDGKTFTGWQTRDGKPVTKGWVVVDGCIYRELGGGDIVTVDTYEDFELELEWKVTPGANSGIKYRFKDGLGPEYQVLDDAGHSNGKNPLTSAASLYALFACNDQKTLKPVGEFNKARIVVRGTKFEHWLNGKKVLEVDTASPEWAAAKAKSKFRGKAGYGEGAGRILLQDHGNKVWYRNIRIRRLAPVE